MSAVEMPHKDVPPPLELVKGRIEELLPPAASDELDGAAAVIDVRDPERFENGHLANAINISSGEGARGAHDESFAAAVEKAAGGRDKRVILFCGQGNRSARTADTLASEHGFSNVASVVGGVKLWSDLGLPVEGEIVVGDEEAETQYSGEEDTT
jgi:rhodanese-related sulfurtransferase